ncbi:MAG: hypothetical protein AAFO02_00625 [Bacteroidota bacterium]
MKQSILYVLVVLIVVLASCNPHLREVLEPIQYIPANCECRLRTMAANNYRFELSALQQVYPYEVAQDSATVRTHRLIAETLLKLYHHPERQKRFCDCIKINNPNNYATPSIFDEDIRRIEERFKSKLQ